MRRLHVVSAVFLFSFLFAACTDHGPTGVLLRSQLYPTKIGARPTDTIPAGSMVEYMGEYVLDSTFMKVMFDVGSGYIPVSEIVLNARPGLLLRETEVFESDSAGAAVGFLPEGTIVAVDTSIQSRSHLYFIGTDEEQHDAWVSSAAIEFSMERNLRDHP